MKRFWMVLLTAFLLCGTGLTAYASTQTEPWGQSQNDVLAQFSENFDENTYLAHQKDGVFTVSMRDGLTLTAAVKTGDLPEGARLMVVAVPQGGEAYAWFSSVLEGTGGGFRPYALSFVKNGERIPFEGELKVRLTVPQGMAEPQIYCVSTQGQANYLTGEAKDGALDFSTRYDTPYYVLLDRYPDSENPPSTGDNISLTFLLMVCASGALLIVCCKNRPLKRDERKEGSQWNW